MKRLSLRYKLPLLALLAVLLPLVIVGLINLRLTTNLIRDKVITDERSRLQRLNDEIGIFLDTVINDAKLVSASSTLQDFSQTVAAGSADPGFQRNRDALTQELANLLQLRRAGALQLYEHIDILDTNGLELIRIDNALGSAHVASSSELKSHTQEDSFKKLLTLHADQIQAFPAGFYDNAANAQPTQVLMRFGKPIYQGSSLTALLMIDVQTQSILSPVSNELPSGTTTFLVDSKGNYLDYPDQGKLFGIDRGTAQGLQSDYPTLSFLLTGIQSGVSDLDRGIATYRPIFPPGGAAFHWTLVSIYPTESLLALLQQQQTTLYVAFGIVGILTSLLALLVAHNISNAIVDVTHTALAIAKGNFDRLSTVTRTDEIGTLQTSINSMASQIKESIQNLELRVRERTRELELARQAADNASNAKSLFLANMSHELRTPLNVIIGYSSSILQMPQMFGNVALPDIYRRYIGLIEESGHYLLGLINDILDLSKIEAGKLELHCANVGLPELFQGILATSLGLVKDKPVQLRPDFPPDLPEVWADSTRVRQVLLNLMSNAIKFTLSGSVTLSACREGNVVKIAVMDTGVGIPEQALSTIFDRFQQAERGIEKRYGGTGLGLEISKRLCLMHGDDLTVQSTVNQGSTFTFCLPISTEQPSMVAQPATPAGSALTFFDDLDDSEIELHPTHAILIVEQEVDIRQLMHEVLEGANYVVIDVQNGANVVEMAAETLPDLIIFDAEASRADGWEVIRQLKTAPQTSAIPVLVCAPEGFSEKARELGAIGYIHKPFTSELLLNRVRNAIQVVAM